MRLAKSTRYLANHLREIWRDFPIQNPEFKSYHNWWNSANLKSGGNCFCCAPTKIPYISFLSRLGEEGRPSKFHRSYISFLSRVGEEGRPSKFRRFCHLSSFNLRLCFAPIKMAEKATKLKQRKRKEKQGNEHEGDDKCYLRWNIQMDRSLAEILREERQMGHKGDGGWKSVAYNTAAAILSAQYNIEVSADNIKNRVKTWKRFYAVVSDILSQSGFSWDATKKMITIDEENVWNEYVKSHEDARTFRYKVIANWDDIVDLCGKDRATGEGAETCSEAAEVMTLDSEPNNFVDLGADTQGFENSHIDDVSPNSSCPKKRNQPSSEIRPPKKRGHNY
ncbi:uncharacterized protein LOC110761592 [Prunus avium]|uniref:Uncharacterized protein LOC110761592 n=1 Tax=Prunus avium TaxID=42229 RepID=A0A6P5T0Q7_PRUAV|nr:uncharacterized protein LOC110761592 [Prunus avium]